MLIIELIAAFLLGFSLAWIIPKNKNKLMLNTNSLDQELLLKQITELESKNKTLERALEISTRT